MDIVAVDEQRKPLSDDCLYSNKPYTMEAYDDFVETAAI